MAQNARVSLATVYRHFSTRDEMILAAISSNPDDFRALGETHECWTRLCVPVQPVAVSACSRSTSPLWRQCAEHLSAWIPLRSDLNDILTNMT